MTNVPPIGVRVEATAEHAIVHVAELAGGALLFQFLQQRPQPQLLCRFNEVQFIRDRKQCEQRAPRGDLPIVPRSVDARTVHDPGVDRTS